MQKIDTKYLIGGAVVLLLVGLVGSAFIGPKLITPIVVGFGGEGDKRYSVDGYETGLEFAPNMYHSEALESYTQWKPSVFRDGRNMQYAPKGTVPRNSWYVAENFQPYHFENTPEAYDSASNLVKSPLVARMEAITDTTARKAMEKDILIKGDSVYKTFCAICHGDKGDGNGTIVESEKYPTPGSYESKVGLTEGKMYHSITYGKNLMGSYASQITPEQRWQVIYYIKKNFLKNAPAAAPAATATPAKADAKPATAKPAETKPAAVAAKPAAKPAEKAPAAKPANGKKP
ncbi:MAG: c-type cytochrome [Bacteroidia bacterium]